MRRANITHNMIIGFGMQYPSYASNYWENYYFAKNLQGDVIALYRSDYNSSTGAYYATLIATYAYDPWGNPTGIYNPNGTSIAQNIAHVAAYNPFRYRGYRYDADTGFYYLQSRYYDPTICRFINADIPEIVTVDFENITQYNLFAYCFNNPINLIDDGGSWPSWIKKAVAAVAVVATVAVVAAVTVATAGAGTAAAVIAVGAAKGAAMGMVSGAAIGAATGAVSHRVSTGSWKGAGTAALNAMSDGALSGAISGAITGGLSRGVQVLRNTRVTNARSLPRAGKRLSSQSLARDGNVTQTRYYNWRGKATWDIDFTNHGTPLKHSSPHAHKWGSSGRSGPMNGFGFW